MVQYRRGRSSPWMVQLRDPNGLIVTRSFTKKEDAQAFERAERRKKQLVRAGLEAPKEQILFVDFAKTWLNRRYKSLARSSADHDESRLRNYWLEKFGVRPLASITSADIRQHLDFIQFECNHSPSDRNRHRALVHRLFQEAYLEERIVANPASRVPLIEEVPVRKKTVLRELAEIDAYLAALREDSPHYAMIGEIMAWTGARVGSAVALQYQDIRFTDGVVLIRRTEERASEGSQIVNRTKGKGIIASEADAEIVPLFPRLRTAILEHRQRSHFTKDTDFIACRSNGAYVPYDTFKGAHKRAIAKCGFPQSVTPHTIRASFATLCKKAGYTRAEIREMLGHSSEAITARYDIRDVAHLVSRGKEIHFGETPKMRAVKGGVRK